jgi:hypothetical protein
MVAAPLTATTPQVRRAVEQAIERGEEHAPNASD